MPLGMHFMVSDNQLSLYWIKNLIPMFFLWYRILDETIPSDTFDTDDPDSFEIYFSMESILEGQKILIVIGYFLTGLFPSWRRKNYFQVNWKKLKQIQTLFLSAARHLDY